MNNYQKLLLPISLLLGLFVGYIFIGNYFITRIFALQNQIKLSKEEEIALQRKLVTLQESNANFETIKDRIVLVVPGSNPVLVGVNQIRKFAAEEGIVINNLAAGQISQDVNLNKVTISFDLDGDSQEIFRVIEKLSNSAPISVLSKVSFADQGNARRFTIVANFYWSALPTQIPSVSDTSLGSLTSEEENVITMLSDLTYPEFNFDIDNVIRGSVPDRSDPFSLE